MSSSGDPDFFFLILCLKGISCKGLYRTYTRQHKGEYLSWFFSSARQNVLPMIPRKETLDEKQGPNNSHSWIKASLGNGRRGVQSWETALHPLALDQGSTTRCHAKNRLWGVPDGTRETSHRPPEFKALTLSDISTRRSLLGWKQMRNKNISCYI